MHASTGGILNVPSYLHLGAFQPVDFDPSVESEDAPTYIALELEDLVHPGSYFAWLHSVDLDVQLRMPGLTQQLPRLRLRYQH